MAIVQLGRQGKAAAGCGADTVHGLDDLCRRQAAAVATMLDTQHSKRPELLSSPMARAFETAQALADVWQVPIDLEPRVAEIPSPTEDLEARAEWLSQAMAGDWSDLEASVQQWRQELAEFLLSCDRDCIIFSHYVAINAAVGAAMNDDRMRIFGPDNCSVTTLSNSEGKLSVVQLGRVAHTHIN